MRRMRPKDLKTLMALYWEISIYKKNMVDEPISNMPTHGRYFPQ